MATINFPASPSVSQIYSIGTKSWIWTGTAWRATSSSGTSVTNNRLVSTASGGQTVFTSPSYTQGANQVSVFVNGVKQYNTDYIETSNTSITLSNAATVGDNVLIEVNGYAGNPLLINTPNIIDDNISNIVLYPLMSPSTSGSLSLVNTSSADFTFNPSTNVLFVPKLQFADGTTITTSFTAAGSYANSAYAQANGASIYANGAFIQANAAFLQANTPDYVANSAALYANGAFTAANNALPKTWKMLLK